MPDTRTLPIYGEIIKLSNSELVKRAMAALDTFMEAIKLGGNVAEKAQLYNAYQDERLNRLNFKNTRMESERIKWPTKNC